MECKTLIIKTVGYLIQKMPGKKAELELAVTADASIEDCVVAIGLPVDDYIVMVNGDFKPMSYIPIDRETLTIINMILGG